MEPDSNDACSWCRRALDPGDCWLLVRPAEDVRAAFCRLEHIVPWAMRDPGWSAGAPQLPEGAGAPVVLVRRRGEHSLVEGFESVDAAAAWAKAGGPWAP